MKQNISISVAISSTITIATFGFCLINQRRFFYRQNALPFTEPRVLLTTKMKNVPVSKWSEGLRKELNDITGTKYTAFGTDHWHLSVR